MCIYIHTLICIYTTKLYLLERWSSVTIIVNWKTTSFQRLAQRISPAGFSLLSNFSKRPRNYIYSVINAFGKEAMTASPMGGAIPTSRAAFVVSLRCQAAAERRWGARGEAPSSARLWSHSSESATRSKKWINKWNKWVPQWDPLSTSCEMWQPTS